MLVFLPSSTVIPRADKGSFIRRKVYVELAAQIDQGSFAPSLSPPPPCHSHPLCAAYDSLEGVDGGDAKIGSLESVQGFVRDLVVSVAEADGLEDETDLFTFGLDSLTATRIRNALQRVRSLFSLVVDILLTRFLSTGVQL